MGGTPCRGASWMNAISKDILMPPETAVCFCQTRCIFIYNHCLLISCIEITENSALNKCHSNWLTSKIAFKSLLFSEQLTFLMSPIIGWTFARSSIYFAHFRRYIISSVFWRKLLDLESLRVVYLFLPMHSEIDLCFQLCLLNIYMLVYTVLDGWVVTVAS